MSNIVSFKPDQRGRVIVDQSADRGRILFFTGVRYMREEAACGSQLEPEAVLCEADPVDAAAATERLKA